MSQKYGKFLLAIFFVECYYLSTEISDIQF